MSLESCGVDPQIEGIGAVREWDWVCNSEPETWLNAGNETSLLHHTGMGTMVELVHDSEGDFRFMPGLLEVGGRVSRLGFRGCQKLGGALSSAIVTRA